MLKRGVGTRTPRQQKQNGSGRGAEGVLTAVRGADPGTSQTLEACRFVRCCDFPLHQTRRVAPLAQSPCRPASNQRVHGSAYPFFAMPSNIWTPTESVLDKEHRLAHY